MKDSKATIKDLFRLQRKFNDIFYDMNALESGEREEITKSLTLALHTEVSSLISAINFKDHRQNKKDVDEFKILFESVDIFRYLISILNIWDITPERFTDAFLDKDLFLHTRYKLNSNKWSGQDVVIVDLDDILIEFRNGFLKWISDEHDIFVDPDSKEYYTTSEIKATGLNPEKVFSDFIKLGGLRSLKRNQRMIDVVNRLHSDGYWVQLLTARPSHNLVCYYDTFRWIENSNLSYDRLDFSSEKYRWCTQSDYFDSGSISCAIDDSAKHAAEYAKHGIPVFLPAKSYNTEVHDMDNIIVFTDPDDICRKIKSFKNK
jgi:hypothetical protein|tara:strand:- start:2344 stop:3297 length:954 start_codon:yes stop_codon:yes gene_type:complete